MRIFQVRMLEKSRRRRGFTLVEVLTALVMTALLAWVAAVALTSVLRVESRALRLREGVMALETVVAVRRSTGKFPDEVSTGPSVWRVERLDPVSEAGREWQRIEIHPHDGRSPVLSTCFPTISR